MGQQAATAGLPILAGIGIGVATGNPMLGFAAASGGSALLGGYSEMRASEAEAAQAKVQEKQAKVQGEQRANEIRRQIAATLGQQNAILASRGVSIGAGAADTLAAETRRIGADDLRVNRLNTLTEMSALRASASQARAAGQSAMLGGILGAAQAGFLGWDAWKNSRPHTETPAAPRFYNRTSPAGRGPYLRRSST